MEQLIRQVIATLDKVEVKGRDNIDRLLGSIVTLEKIADAMRHNREALAKAQTTKGRSEDDDQVE